MFCVVYVGVGVLCVHAARVKVSRTQLLLAIRLLVSWYMPKESERVKERKSLKLWFYCVVTVACDVVWCLSRVLPALFHFFVFSYLVFSSTYYLK